MVALNRKRTKRYLHGSGVKKIRDLTHLFPRATVEAFVQFANGKGHEELVVHEFFLGVAAGAARVQAVACPVRGAGPSGAARTH